MELEIQESPNLGSIPRASPLEGHYHGLDGQNIPQGQARSYLTLTQQPTASPKIFAKIAEYDRILAI